MEFGKITLNQLSIAIERNLKQAQSLGVKLAWGFTKDRRIYAKIYNQEYICYEKYYQGKHVHYHIAEIHNDFSLHMDSMEQAKKRAKYLEDKERQEMTERNWRK